MITFVQTGGTIDKDYAKPSKAYNFEFGEPAIKRILQEINPNFEYRSVTAFKKDSLDMTDSDRTKLRNLVAKLKADKIIVTHGSDTMVRSAKALSSIKNKTIVFTASRYPERFKGSDAAFNIGFAIASVQHLPHGVYLAMNGRVHTWNNTKKNLVTGRFEEI